MQSLSQRMRQRAIHASLFVAIGLIASSCSEGKLSQCRKLIDVANQVVSDVQTVAQNTSSTAATGSSAESIAVINKVAEAADKANIRMEELTLTDDRLENFQTRYAAMYTEIGQTTRDMLAAAEEKDRQAGKDAYDAFKAATSQEGTLVEEINAYCAE